MALPGARWVSSLPLVLLALFLSGTRLNADSITYYFEDVYTNQGAELTGWFQYDPVAHDYGSADMTLTNFACPGANCIASVTYTGIYGPSSGASIQTQTPEGGNYGEPPAVGVSFDTDLDVLSGDEVDDLYLPGAPNGEIYAAYDYTDYYISGYVTASPPSAAPEPGTGPVVLLAGALLMWATKRRRVFQPTRQN